ncbi:hypothetical protein BLAT2472_50266 [Burkholderia latens]
MGRWLRDTGAETGTAPQPAGGTVGSECGHDIGPGCQWPIKCRDAVHSIPQCAARMPAWADEGAVAAESAERPTCA